MQLSKHRISASMLQTAKFLYLKYIQKQELQYIPHWISAHNDQGGWRFTYNENLQEFSISEVKLEIRDSDVGMMCALCNNVDSILDKCLKQFTESSS